MLCDELERRISRWFSLIEVVLLLIVVRAWEMVVRVYELGILQLRCFNLWHFKIR